MERCICCNASTDSVLRLDAQPACLKCYATVEGIKSGKLIAADYPVVALFLQRGVAVKNPPGVSDAAIAAFVMALPRGEWYYMPELYTAWDAQQPGSLPPTLFARIVYRLTGCRPHMPLRNGKQVKAIFLPT